MKKRFMVSVVILTLVLFGFSALSSMAAENIKMGGTLKIAHSKAANNIGNPQKLRGWNHEFVDNTLQTILLGSNENLGGVEPFLATSYELASDRSYYIFKLRKGIKFHDGTDCNAQAVKWNHDQWVESKSPTLGKVTSIEIIDDLTLKYNISQWDATTLGDFAWGTFVISPTAFEKNGEAWVDQNPVGTGPFKFVSDKRNTFVKFEKFKDYWDKGLPYLDKLEFYTIPDPMTCMAALKSKEVDAWLGVDVVSASQAIAEGELVVQQHDAVYNVLQFNSIDPESPWSNIKLRKAVEHAIDKEAIVQSISRGIGRAVYTVLHSIDKIPPGPGTTPRTYDPEKAKQLMKEAGYPNGLKVNLKYAANPVAGDTVVAMQGMLKEIGIEIVPEPLAGAKFNETLFQPTPHGDLIMGNLRGGGAQVLGSSNSNFGRGSIFFQSVQKPEGFQDLIEEAMLLEDQDKINELLFKAERLAYDFAMDVPLVQAKFTGLSQPYVKNAYWFWGAHPYPNLQKTWLDK